MNWQEVCENDYLKNIPFKIELNRFGQVVMSPAKNQHSIYQEEIEYLLRTMSKTGKAYPGCPIQTTDGVKVADVVWISPERYQQVKNEEICSVAPEICIEVKSASNTQIEMSEKRNLYLAAGAKEIWFCDGNGEIHFFDQQVELNQSQLVPDFPKKILL
jgi:Uma2 family endonuclease